MTTETNNDAVQEGAVHPMHTTENQYSRARRSSRSSGSSSRRSSRRSSKSSRRSKNESPATRSPLLRQAFLTALFLFGLFLVFNFVTKHLKLSDESKVVAKLKQEELKNSWDIVYVPSRHAYSNCKEWSEYHSKRKQLLLGDRIRHYKEFCVSQGHY